MNEGCTCDVCEKFDSGYGPNAVVGVVVDGKKFNAHIGCIAQWLKPKPPEEENRGAKIALISSDDTETIPDIPITKPCSKCGFDAPLYSSDSERYVDAMGYWRHRMRVVVRCRLCGQIDTYRIGGYVFTCGQMMQERNGGGKNMTKDDVKRELMEAMERVIRQYMPVIPTDAAESLYWLAKAVAVLDGINTIPQSDYERKFGHIGDDKGKK